MRNTNLTRIAVVALFAAAPLAAQGGGGGMAGMPGMGGRAADPTTKVVGSGQLPAGWMMRFDPPGAGKPAQDIKEISFVTMGDGYHFKSGPAAIYYNPKDIGKGIFGVSATFHQAKSMQHETYGLFIGGANLQDSTQGYIYFVIRPSDGSYQIKVRGSNAAPPRIASPPIDPAIVKDDPKDGSATNTLTIHVAKDTVHFMVNGKLVKAMSKAELGRPTDGQVGLRINHNLDVHVSGYGIKK
jgi:hypothetical protein